VLVNELLYKALILNYNNISKGSELPKRINSFAIELAFRREDTIF